MKKILFLVLFVTIISSCVHKSKYDLLEERVERMEKLFCRDNGTCTNREGAEKLYKIVIDNFEGYTSPIDTFMNDIKYGDKRRNLFVSMKEWNLYSKNFDEFEKDLGIQQVDEEYKIFYNEITNTIVQVKLLEERVKQLEAENDILRNCINIISSTNNSPLNNIAIDNINYSLNNIVHELRMNYLLK